MAASTIDTAFPGARIWARHIGRLKALVAIEHHPDSGLACPTREHRPPEPRRRQPRQTKRPTSPNASPVRQPFRLPVRFDPIQPHH
jgi:hypothetical protein